MRILTVILALVSGLLAPVSAQNVINPDDWELIGDETKIVMHMGRPAIRVTAGAATMKGVTFKNGFIEFDVAMPEDRGFAGVLFRHNGDEVNEMAENFYLRSHMSGKPDANQYMPVINGTSSWQLYMGPRYSAPTEYQYGAWNHVKLAVKDGKMDVYVNSDTPVLHVDPFLLDPKEGAVIFSAFMNEYFFSNMRVTATDDVELVGTATPLKELPKGLITHFMVSKEPVDNTLVEAKAWLDKDLMAHQEWVKLEVEETGAANLARISPLKEKAKTRLVKLTISSEEARTIQVRYGFSDRATVFLNGHALAYGDDRYMSRDYRFLGTIGLYDTIFLPLETGDNEVVFAVSESFGGWGFIAALEDREGLKIW